MSPQERRSPEPQSLLGAVSTGPTLTPKLTRPKVGAHAGEDHDQGHEHDDELEEPTARPPRPGRTRGGRRPPPAAADAIPTTIRFDQEEAAEVDQFVLELRVQAGRRNLDKAEVFREVLRLAREHEPTRRALLKRLR